MEETELEDLDLEERLDLEHHLYCLLHYNDTEISETMAHDTDNNVTLGRVILHTPIRKENQRVPSIEECSMQKTMIEKNIIDEIDASKYDIVMTNILSNDVISVDSSDSEADVIEIVPPAPPVICIESDESDDEQHNESTYCIGMKSSNHKKPSLDKKQMKELCNNTPITTMLATKTSPIVNCLTEKPPQCSSPMSVISDDFIQKDYESLNITDKSDMSSMFNFSRLDISTSTHVPNSVLDSDTNSDCSELPINHQIFVHSDERVKAHNKNQKNEFSIIDAFKIPSDVVLDMSEKDNSDLNYSYNEGQCRSTSLKACDKNPALNSHDSLKKLANLQAKKRSTLGQMNNSKNNMIDKIAHLSMEEFYLKSWNGEKFNHDEIISNMSRNKDDWRISILDKSRYQKPRWRPIRCRNCKQMGHTAAQCKESTRTIKCSTCGTEGHSEPRCPNSICLRCGSPSSSYVIGCVNCNSSRFSICQLCGMAGHHQNYCPDLWRRYHKSVDQSKQPIESHTALKPSRSLFCSNCSLRGHLYHNCQKLRINEHTMTIPNILAYTPVYPIKLNDSSVHKNNPLHESINDPDVSKSNRIGKRKINDLPLMTKQSKTRDENAFLNNLNDFEAENCILTSIHMNETSLDDNLQNTNKFHDSMTQTNFTESFKNNITFNDDHVTQDNNVTSSDNKVTSGRLMLNKDTLSVLMKREGTEFISETCKIMNISVQIKFTSNLGFLSLIGTKTQQDNFQEYLKDWIKKYNLKLMNSQGGPNLPQKTASLSRYLQEQFRALSKDIMSPLKTYHNIKAIENSINIVNRKQIKLYKRSLKKLNMILFGKFGYRDGTLHKEKLVSNLQELDYLIPTIENTPLDLYNDIKLHHDYIFEPIYHGNYEELLDLFKEAKDKLGRGNQIKVIPENMAKPILRRTRANQIQSNAVAPTVQKKNLTKFEQDTNKLLMQAESAIHQARCNHNFRKKSKAQLELFSKKAKHGIFGHNDMLEMRKFLCEIEKKIY